MAKYARQNVEALALAMQNAKDAGKPFAVLMGAGCSYKAGIPLADGLLLLLNESHNGARLRSKLECKTLVGQDYGAVMGKMPIAERKTFFDPILKKAGVNWGHIALAGLMKADFVGRVLTFNFDAILARACGINGLYPAVYDFGVAPSKNLAHLVMPSIIHLHGQGHGAVMKNSADETEKHATEIMPLLKSTLDDFGLLVIGYSGDSDKVFPKLVESYNNQQQLWWCEHKDIDQSGRVKALLDKSQDSAEYLRGVDFDGFMIDLAQELKCFPPILFTDPAQHLLDDIAPILPPPEDLQSAKGLLEDLKEKLSKWRVDPESIESRLRLLVLQGQYKAAISLKNRANTAASKDQIAWAYIMQGNNISDDAKLKQDEKLFIASFAKYEAALGIKPDSHEALYNWGNALANLARAKGNDETLWREAITKYEAALAIKPDSHEALNNWGLALANLARAKGNDETLLHGAIAKYEAALQIKPDSHEALHNWGAALANLARAKGNDEALWRDAITKYEAALAIKPDSHKALNNWGLALANLARAKGNDETLWGDAITKYEAALGIKPDYHQALNNWVSALLQLYHKSPDEALLVEAEAKAAEAQRLEGKASYNLACVYARQKREEDCHALLLRCKADGTLMDAAHMAADNDLEAYWEREWFKALLA
jgi:Tfp pilus assembly protein PilF